MTTKTPSARSATSDARAADPASRAGVANVTTSADGPDGSRGVGGAGERSSWWPLAVVLAGLFVTNVDFFIVNVAIPSLRSGMHATGAQIQLVAAVFTLGMAASLITSGRLGDLLGRRRMFSAGVVVFTLASLVCGAAPGMAELIGARFVQGVAAAMVIPQVLGILATAYPGRHRATAFTAYGVTLGAAAVFGQLIGGLLIKADPFGLDWRSVFLINVPVGAAVVALTPRLVPEARAGARGGLDLTGAAVVTVGTAALVWPLIQGRQDGWPQWTWVCGAAAVLVAAVFRWHQRRLAARGREPLVDLSLFRDRGFGAGTVTVLVFFSAMASFFLVLALYLQDGRGTGALTSGLLFVPLGCGFFVGSARASALGAGLGPRVLALGALVVAAGDLALARTASALGHSGAVAWCLPAMAVCGLGMGLVVAPLTSLVLEGVPREHAAAASGVLSTAQELGNTVGIALLGVVFFHVAGRHQAAQGYPAAFRTALYALAATNVLVAALVRLLPGTAPAERE